MMRRGGYPQRVAMISMHTSPLETPGVGDAGGLNVYVAELARRLGERGLEVDIFTRRSDSSAPETVDCFERVRVRHVDTGPASPVTKEALPDLVDAFAQRLAPELSGYDLVHSHYWLSGMVALACSDPNRPIVHTMHTMARVKNAVRGAGHLTEPDVREQGEAAIVRDVSMITANTIDEARELEVHYGALPDRVAIVPPGVDLHTFHPCNQPKWRADLGVDVNAEMILFVGRIQPLKAPDVLIRAAAELIRMKPSRRDTLRLIIIGSPSGPEAQWSAGLPSLARDLGIDAAVDFRPHSPRDELFRWYCASNVVGVPSFNESFGLVALEAQACGRPVVATGVGGLRHAVLDQQTGLLVAGHDPADWARAFEAILDDHDRAARLGANAAAHASGFSWDNTAAATLEAYRLAASH